MITLPSSKPNPAKATPAVIKLHGRPLLLVGGRGLGPGSFRVLKDYLDVEDDGGQGALGRDSQADLGQRGARDLDGG
jgi:hypothetical protein